MVVSEVFPGVFTPVLRQISLEDHQQLLSHASDMRRKTKLFDLEIRHLNSFPNKPWFLRVFSTSLLKTLWGKEKLLVTSNFPFTHSVFYCLENFLQFSSNLKLSSADCFNFEESKICCLGKG